MTTRSSIISLLAMLFSAGLGACTPAPNVAASPATSATSATAPAASSVAATARDVQWSRVAAEHTAIFVETYRAAANRLESLSAGRAQGSWGVILDADETVLDNSDYELARVPFGGSFDASAWDTWVAAARAPALPGAVAFTSRVHQLGGKVVIVSNRSDRGCPATRANLDRVSIRADLVVCKTDKDDKNPRFDAVQSGTASPGFPAIAVLEWIGDNIQDFPHLSQAIREEPESAFAKFGDTFFALPNPMYGSWQSSPLK
jgi:5'-nucleotidase (lipoprotein e(P4) family)